MNAPSEDLYGRYSSERQCPHCEFKTWWRVSYWWHHFAMHGDES